MYSNRNPFKPLSCNFSELLDNSRFSDFIINIPNAEKEEDSQIRVHRFILSERSKYFHQLFETTPSESSVTVYFPQFAVSEIRSVLVFFYSSEDIELKDSNISAIYLIANIWGVESLKNRAKDFIINDLSPKYALDTLGKLSCFLDHDSQIAKHLIDIIYKNIIIYKPADFASLPFDLFDQILDLVNLSRPILENVDALCNCIEYYAKENIEKLGRVEVETLIQRFNFRTSTSGILTLYKYAIQFNWGVQYAHVKLLHMWRFLDKRELAKLPLNRLAELLNEDYINTNNEDEILDFILLVCEAHKEEKESILDIWNTLRVPSLSDEYKRLLKNCKEAPEEIKEKLVEKPEKYLTRRVPLVVQKLLILGAADDLSLNDVKDMLVSSCFVEENITMLRADKEIDDVDFSEFHAILLFGFYKFYDAKKLSEKLAAYVEDGGGLVVAYGANRTDEFGIGEPLQSMLPMDAFGKETVKKLQMFPDVQEREQSAGNRNMRVLFKAKEGCDIVSQWDDGVPFIVLQWKTDERGGIIVFNATPVSSDIIPEQWSKHDKLMGSYLIDSIVSVASICFSKNKR